MRCVFVGERPSRGELWGWQHGWDGWREHEGRRAGERRREGRPLPGLGLQPCARRGQTEAGALSWAWAGGEEQRSFSAGV